MLAARLASLKNPGRTTQRVAQRPGPARISRLARRPGMARSRALAWACGLDWPTLLVWTPLGSATVLRHHHRRCRTRHTHHCRCSWVRPGAASSQPVLVLGGSLRKPRVLGLLFLDVRPTNEMRATLTGGASLFTPTGSSAWNGMQATRFGRTSLQPRAANVSHRLGMCECRVGASSS